jgi:predicted MFS family arabinose efflux permease
VTILTSRYSRYKTLLALMLVFLIGNTLSGVATSYWFMVISRVITAFTAGSIISLVMTFASTIAPRNKRASLVSWIFAGFSIASVFGVPIGVAISTSYNWRWAFFGISAITILTFILLVFRVLHLHPAAVNHFNGFQRSGPELAVVHHRYYEHCQQPAFRSHR